MEHIRLGDIYRITKGKKIEPLEELVDEAIRYIQIDDLRNDNNLKYCLNDKKYVIADKDDLIIAWDGANAGTIGYGLSGAIGSTLARLSTSNDNIYTPFVGRYMQSQSKELRDKCTGATIPHIQKSVLEDVLIPKYDISTQKMLANILDKAQYLIDLRKEQIQACDELIKSQFIEMFGTINNPVHPVYKLSELANIKHGFAFKGEFFTDVDNGVVLVTPGNFQLGGGFQEKKCKFFTGEYSDEYVLAPGDLIVTMTDLSKKADTLGYGAIVPQNERIYLHNQRIGLFEELDEKLNKVFLAYYLQTPAYRAEILATATGSTVHHTSPTKILATKVLVPPIELQNQFAQFVQQVDKLKFEMEQSLVELENNFNALMQRAFKGELF